MFPPALPGKACFTALMTSSVVINPRLTALEDITLSGVGMHLQRNRPPGNRCLETTAKGHEIPAHFDLLAVARNLDLVLQRRQRQDAVMSLLQVQPRFSRLNRERLS